MKATIIAALTFSALALSPAIAHADIIDQVTYDDTTQGRVWNVIPTEEGRSMGSSALSSDPTDEMVGHGIIPATKSLADQLICHVVFAPGKTVWELEDWHADVGLSSTVLSGCNP